MRRIFFLLLTILSIGVFAQSTGYVLQMQDGSIRIPDNSISINKVSTLSQALGAKASLTGSEVVSGKTIMMFNYGVDAGNNDTYVISLSPALTSYVAGQIILFKANTVNTGAASININGLGAKTIVKRVNTTLANGDIPALATCLLIYDGTNFILMNPVVN